MNLNKMIRRRSICLILLLIFSIINLSGLFSKIVKAQDIFSVNVTVETLGSKIVDNFSSGKVNAYDALIDTLTNNGNRVIQYSIPDTTYGKSLNVIDNISATPSQYWMYAVNRNGTYVDIMSSIDNFTLNNGDKLIVYCAGSNTLTANRIDFSTLEPNKPITITINNYDSYSKVTTPIKNIKVKLDSSEYQLTDNKLILEQGLQEGTHRLELSDFRTTGTPNVVADTFEFKINSASSNSNNNSSSTGSQNQSNQSNSTTVNLQEAIALTTNNVKLNQNAWTAISFSRIGIKPDEKFIQEAYDDIKKNGLDDLYNTDIEKLIMALTACGYNPYSFAGYDLVSYLYSKDINNFYTNDAIFGLMAYNYANINGEYKINRDSLISFILKNKLSYKQNTLQVDGWTYFGNTIDPDLTGFALSALAPYYNKNSDVKNAIDNVVKSLSNLQNIDGYIPSQYGISSETISSVILGLTSIGINPEADMFKKEKGDLVTSLLSFRGTDGQFKHELNGGNNKIATEQALRALISLDEFRKQGKFNLYTSNIDASKLKVFEVETLATSGPSETNKANDNLSKELPQTGVFLDFKLFTVLGVIMIGFGIGIIRFKSKGTN